MRYALGLGIILLMGCSGSGYQSQLYAVNTGVIKKADARPVCEVQAAEYLLDAQMVDFEITSNTGISFGLSLLSGLFHAFDLNFKMASGRLDLSMSLYDPMRADAPLYSATGKSSIKGLNFNFDANVYLFNFGISSFYETPLSTLTTQGLENNLAALNKSISNLQEPWNTQVVAVDDPASFVIPMGSFANVKVGDEFAIYNVEHIWSGLPCASDHLLTKKVSQPVIARAVQVENSASLLKVMVPDLDAPVIIQGARVEISQLTDPKRQLSRSVQIRNVLGAEMTFSDTRKADLTPYMKTLLNSSIVKYGYTLFSAL